MQKVCDVLEKLLADGVVENSAAVIADQKKK
jgi:hypothetical protein